MNTSLDLEPFRLFLTLKDEKAEIEASLKDLNAKIAKLVERLPDVMTDAGVPSVAMTHNGRKVTLYPKTICRARPKDGDKEGLHTALISHGFGDIVKPTVNAQTLTSLVTEFSNSDEGLPAWLEDVISVYNDTRLNSTSR